MRSQSACYTFCMQTRTLIFLLVPLFIVAGFLVRLPRNDGASSTQSSPIIDPQVALVVSQFGKQMQYVSLQAPALDIQAAMDKYYTPYVTPELLSVWKAKPRSAPGRITSSPWPDRIEVQAVEPQRDGSYIVRGNTIEVSGNEVEHGGIAGVYPIVMRLARHGSRWQMMQFEKGAYSEMPQIVTVRGTYSCLPHRDTTGPQTMECAFGLKKDHSNIYYGLDMNLVQSTLQTSLLTGTHMSVTGTLVPVEQLSGTFGLQYGVDGIIRVTNILEPVQ